MDTDNRNTTRENTSSFGSLIASLTNEVTALVRNEVDLAKAEMAQKVSQVGNGIGSIAAAGAVLMCGFLVLLAAAVFGLDTVLQTPWLSALIVGVIVVIIGFIMLQGGKKKLKATNLMPQRTISSVQYDKDLAQHHKGQAKEQLKNER
ncbi:phage holin family protein [Halomonas sp. GXIMD04776]|uniref:phage holin family protein n=1 Tax=Halomonas sp. GXIMD04776 TaxID=3415605 RepID=UPI003CA5902D